MTAADNWFTRTGNEPDGKDVHLALLNPMTGRIGSCYSPREETLTGCGMTWDVGHVTLLPELATCAECLAFERERTDAAGREP